jgi:acetyl-CoA carboxylase carboxyltransferase component
MIKDMASYIEDLQGRQVAAAGTEKDVATQHGKGRLTARERLELLFDANTFNEMDTLVLPRYESYPGGKTSRLGDGVITGFGLVNGRRVFAASQDAAVMGGSLGEMHANKIVKAMQMALKYGCPFIAINDSGGARIQEGVDSLGGYARIFDANCEASGVIPQLSVIMGPCAGGAVYSPALTDFVFMTGNSYMFITGPDVVRSVMQENVSFEELGGGMMHSQESGVCHFLAADDPEFGIVANQPMVLAGCIDIKASIKATHFIRICDAYNVPIITLQDVPGFLPGKEQEYGGIIRNGARMIYAYSEATVPKLMVILRKSYGGAYCVMSSKGLRGDLLYAWPNAEIAVMGAEGAVNILFRRDVQAAEDPEAKRRELVDDYQTKFNNPYVAAARGMIDDVIDPAETRRVLIRSLEVTMSKRERHVPRKHGISPM